MVKVCERPFFNNFMRDHGLGGGAQYMFVKFYTLVQKSKVGPRCGARPGTEAAIQATYLSFPSHARRAETTDV